MEQTLPTMEQLGNCFLEESIKNMTPSGKIRRRSYSTSEQNTYMLMTPTPPLSNIIQSQSMTLPVKKKYIEEYSDYKFHCKNMTTNIKSILDISQSESIKSQTESDLSDSSRSNTSLSINERIIPNYYINNKGIKVGPFNFNFFDGIVDSIRNMRVLTKSQIIFIEKCSRKEYIQLMNEYNKIMLFLNENDLL